MYAAVCTQMLKGSVVPKVNIDHISQVNFESVVLLYLLVEEP